MKTGIFLSWLLSFCFGQLGAQDRDWQLGLGLSWQKSWGLDLELGYSKTKMESTRGEWVPIRSSVESWSGRLGLRPSYLFEQNAWIGAIELGGRYERLKRVVDWSLGLDLGAGLNFKSDLGQVYLKPLAGIHLFGGLFLEYGYALALSNRGIDLGWSPHQIQFTCRFLL